MTSSSRSDYDGSVQVPRESSSLCYFCYPRAFKKINRVVIVTMTIKNVGFYNNIINLSHFSVSWYTTASLTESNPGLFAAGQISLSHPDNFLSPSSFPCPINGRKSLQK